MRLRDVGLALGLAGAGMLVYGALYESNRLVVERHTLRLKDWPERLSGYRIALLGDFHLRDPYSLILAKRAIAEALEAEPDMVALVGDFVGSWTGRNVGMLTELLEPLLLMNGSVVTVPGNHDHRGRSIEILSMILDELNIKLLRNESWKHDGITWVGVDSARESMDDPVAAMKGIRGPAIALWHEPDLVDELPPGCALQLSGHSHGGQFRLPFGFTPMHSDFGRKYVQGFFPSTPTPLYVTRGVGTTGPPSRFLCPPEVAILTLVPA